ncbi:MAG: MarR family winged helix-turn-helix transcriptional regulator [Burkholderiaceae bacterium]
MSRARAQLAAVPVDREAHASEDHHDALRLWLRLLTCTMLIEREIRARLRERFAITLPRFDLMAQLERNPQGLRMSDLSRRLMVTGGNVTGLTDQLVAEGLVERQPVPSDRRASTVRLTRAGKRAFDRMAAEHERWIVELLGGLSATEVDRLHALLGRLKTSVRAHARAEED